jgi:division protein CdvB (Snf7/Vps24/ESCRT-III family)
LEAIISEMKDHSSTKFADLEYMMSKIENYEKFLQVKVDGNLEDDDKEEDNDSLREI